MEIPNVDMESLFLRAYFLYYSFDSGHFSLDNHKWGKMGWLAVILFSNEAGQLFPLPCVVHLLPDAAVGQVFPKQHLVPLGRFHKRFVPFRFSGVASGAGDHLARCHLASWACLAVHCSAFLCMEWPSVLNRDLAEC